MVVYSLLSMLRERLRGRQWEGGQGLVEYGLIIALVAIAVVGGLTVMGQTVLGMYDPGMCDLIVAFGGSCP